MLHRLSYPGPLVARCTSAFGVLTVKMSAALDCSVVMYVVTVWLEKRPGSVPVWLHLTYCTVTKLTVVNLLVTQCHVYYGDGIRT